MANRQTISFILGFLAGLIAYAVIGKLGLYLLQISWSDYATYSIDKSYTIQMLLCRLLVGLLAAIAAGIAAASVTNNRKAALFAGIIILCAASYIHFVKVWSDYPVWYHLGFLLPIIPVIGLSDYIFIRKK